MGGARERAGVVWDPAFGNRHPGIETLRPGAGWPSWPQWPDMEQLQSLLDRADPRATNANGRPLRLERFDASAPAAAFERRVAADGILPVRQPGWHDLFNVVAWSAWPRAKAALNARHVAQLAPDAGGNRSPARDALTGFDEDGVVIAAADERYERLVREFRWTELFRDHRAELTEAVRVFVFGHALAEKLLAPFVGITGKAVAFIVEPGFMQFDPATQRRQLDDRLADKLKAGDRFLTPRELMPLPVLGLPGWWHEGDDADFYDNSDYFRPGRMRVR